MPMHVHNVPIHLPVPRKYLHYYYTYIVIHMALRFEKFKRTLGLLSRFLTRPPFVTNQALRKIKYTAKYAFIKDSNQPPNQIQNI